MDDQKKREILAALRRRRRQERALPSIGLIVPGISVGAGENPTYTHVIVGSDFSSSPFMRVKHHPVRLVSVKEMGPGLILQANLAFSRGFGFQHLYGETIGSDGLADGIIDCVNGRFRMETMANYFRFGAIEVLCQEAHDRKDGTSEISTGWMHLAARCMVVAAYVESTRRLPSRSDFMKCDGQSLWPQWGSPLPPVFEDLRGYLRVRPGAVEDVGMVRVPTNDLYRTRDRFRTKELFLQRDWMLVDDPKGFSAAIEQCARGTNLDLNWPRQAGEQKLEPKPVFRGTPEFRL